MKNAITKKTYLWPLWPHPHSSVNASLKFISTFCYFVGPLKTEIYSKSDGQNGFSALMNSHFVISPDFSGTFFQLSIQGLCFVSWKWKIANRGTSCLVATQEFLDCLLMKEKFDVYLPIGKTLIFEMVASKEIQIILRLFLVIAMYCQGSSSQIKSITQPPALLAGWEGSLGTHCKYL